MTSRKRRRPPRDVTIMVRASELDALLYRTLGTQGEKTARARRVRIALDTAIADERARLDAEELP